MNAMFLQKQSLAIRRPKTPIWALAAMRLGQNASIFGVLQKHVLQACDEGVQDPEVVEGVEVEVEGVVEVVVEGVLDVNVVPRAMEDDDEDDGVGAEER